MGPHERALLPERAFASDTPDREIRHPRLSFQVHICELVQAAYDTVEQDTENSGVRRVEGFPKLVVAPPCGIRDRLQYEPERPIGKVRPSDVVADSGKDDGNADVEYRFVIVRIEQPGCVTAACRDPA